jgi:hypothetical protein
MELSARFFGKTKLLRAGYDNEDLRPIDGIAPQPILETLNKKHTSGYGRADDAYELGEHPLTFSSLIVAAKTFGRSAHHQCAWKSASTVAIPAIIEPVIAIAAGMALGNSRLTTVATKIAATGRTTTKYRPWTPRTWSTSRGV